MRTRPVFFRLFWWLPLLAAGPIPALLAQPASYVYLHLGQEDGLASNHVLAVLQDRQGFVWLGTGNGLQRYDGRQFVHYRHQPGNPRSLPADIVESLLEDRAGNLWVAAGGQVSRFAPQPGQFVPVPQTAPSPAVGPGRYRLALDGSGRVWWVAPDGAAGLVYDNTRRAFVPTDPAPFPELSSPEAAYRRALASFPSPEPYCVLKDSRGIVWAGGTQLLARHPGDSAFRVIPKRSTPRYGIDYSLIFCLAEDREGTLWVGTDQGLYRFNPDKGRFFMPPETPAVDGDADFGGVTGFLETGDGRVWVGTLRAGIRVYDARLRLLHCYRPTHDRAGPPVAAWGLVQDQQGIVWAGVENGLVGITPGRDGFRTVHSPLLGGQTLLKGVCDEDGILWWGTSSGQIVRWDGRAGQFSVLPLAPDVQARGRVQGLLTGPTDSLWVATAGGGIYQVHKRTGRVGNAYATTTRPGTLLSNQVGSLQWLPDSTLLVSTSAGLHFIDPKTKRVRPRTTANGLPANAILNVMPDRDGSLFLTTQYSLFRWHAPTGRVEAFGARDGLLDQSYAFNTAYRLRDGRVLLGTVHDFYAFHPDSLVDAAPPLPVRLTGLRIFNQPVRLDSALGRDGILRLAHGQNFFTVEFASLHYYDDARIRYYYQLEGVDAGWVAAGVNRFAPYTDVAGGNYRFKVKAVRDNGRATSRVTTLAIRVAQPFWKTGWFAGLAGLALAGGAYGLYRVRINRLLALQRVRARIARDLHDDMGSTLSTINILSAMARQQASANPIKTEEYLEKISTYSQSMMETMDDIVWSVNPVNDTGQNLVARMREFGREILEPKDIAFSLHTDGLPPAVHLPIEIRYDCFLVFKEALNNAAKYARCRRVEVTLSSVGKGLRVDIQDDGIGFDPLQVREGNGLTNMQKRVAHLRGEWQLHAEPGGGTRVTFTVPLT